MNWERLLILKSAGRVKRLHTCETLQEHNIAEHVYGTLLLAEEFIERNPDVNRTAIMRTLLLHDAPELRTGDVPAPIKRKDSTLAAALDRLEDEFYRDFNIDMPVLTTKEVVIVKACDYADLGLAMLREIGLGNRLVGEVFVNIMLYLRDLNRGAQDLEVDGLNDLVTMLHTLEFRAYGS